MFKKYYEFWASKDLGLLVLRVGIGLVMALSHGLGKLQSALGDGPIQFADPIGIGQELSLYLAAGTEFFLSLLLCLGFLTRLVSIPLAFTMLVAIFVIHADDPFAKKEFALLFLMPYLMFILAGGGKYSFDEFLKNRFGKGMG